MSFCFYSILVGTPSSESHPDSLNFCRIAALKIIPAYAILCIASGDTKMTAITTSIRLSPELRGELESAAQKLHRGKNWIISQALHEFLNKINQQDIKIEARKQSLLASKAEQVNEMEIWEQNADRTGWE